MTLTDCTPDTAPPATHRLCHTCNQYMPTAAGGDPRKWRGRRCPDCRNRLEREKNAPLKQALMDAITRRCTTCGQHKPTAAGGEGRQWHSRQCPDCCAAYMHDYYRKVTKPQRQQARALRAAQR